MDENDVDEHLEQLDEGTTEFGYDEDEVRAQEVAQLAPEELGAMLVKASNEAGNFIAAEEILKTVESITE